MSNSDSRFMQDEELRVLLNKWNAPEAPGSLDQRVTASYRQSMSSMDERLSSVLDPQRDSEVVKMKFCNSCQEQFADRFSFCPVDGTPLSAVPTPIVAPTNTSAPLDIEVSYPMSETVSQARPRATAPSAPVPVAATPIAAVSSAAASAMIGEYHLTILEDRGLLPRLASELGEVAHNYQLTWPEFKRDPFGFTKRSFQGYGKMVGKFFASRDAVIATLLSFVAMAVLVGAIFLLDRSGSGGPSRRTMIVVAIIGFCGLLAVFATWLSRDRGAAVMGARPSDSRNVLSGIIASFALLFFVVGGAFLWDRHQQAKAAELAKDDLELTQMITDIPNEQPTPDEGAAGTNKGSGGGSKPKQEKPGGGGGGGREEEKPASFGKTPQGSLTVPQVVAPDPHPPKLNPSLPWASTLNVDEPLIKADTRNLNYGDPKSKSTDISSGPGSGNGIGTGTGTGIGSGEGNGLGPGRGGNTGGGDFKQGGGGPGGGGGGGPDYTKIFNGKEVTSKARVLEKPEPTYTEAARKNQITGTVTLRAIFSSSGAVTNIHAVSGLPDGLTERAIAAAKNIRFVPATKDGHPVSMWMELQYNFNLY